jgi:hypothetical protein
VGVVMDPGSAFNCFGNIITLLCNQPVLPGAWPSAKIINVGQRFFGLPLEVTSRIRLHLGMFPPEYNAVRVFMTGLCDL